ncbi:hypothetical protein [Streptomyces sp. enrichment culture]|uniref:hypothetical protein n=1 Tax=Streptomyces sp. enrichment culture TaxID=1795815 RepID=UPI003F57822B
MLKIRRGAPDPKTSLVSPEKARENTEKEVDRLGGWLSRFCTWPGQAAATDHAGKPKAALGKPALSVAAARLVRMNGDEQLNGRVYGAEHDAPNPGGDQSGPAAGLAGAGTRHRVPVAGRGAVRWAGLSARVRGRLVSARRAGADRNFTVVAACISAKYTVYLPVGQYGFGPVGK